MATEQYLNIFRYLDKVFWTGKTDETNWNYYGLDLDWYFENSVLQYDFLDVEEYIFSETSLGFTETNFLESQYKDSSAEEKLKVIQSILNLLRCSSVDKDKTEKIILKVGNALTRYKVKVNNIDSGYISLEKNDIFSSGSYCDIYKIKDGILLKKLNKEFENDEKQKKRIKYEYENMLKLSECPNILKVYTFDDNDNSYTMEEAEKDLSTHLKDEIELSFDEKLKIITDVLSGMSFAHKKEIIHRDLHLGNILKIKNDFLISDFGLSKDLSIERSMKSSYTEKNNHIFVDPLAIHNFKKLDKKSDIYSIGKLIEYIMDYNPTENKNVFQPVIIRCTAREKSLRYDDVDQIISDITNTLKDNSAENRKDIIKNQIINNVYNASTHEYIINLLNSDSLCRFIVEYKLSGFADFIINFDYAYQQKILDNIDKNFVEATGYNGWNNYDIFTNISYDFYIKSTDIKLKNIAKSILGKCADIRFKAKELFDRINI